MSLFVRHATIVKCLAFVVLASTGTANAAIIDSRTTLQGLLGGPGTMEDFEAYSIASGTADAMNSTFLDTNSVVNGQGPSLVTSGVSFSAPVGALQWAGSGYLGSPSQEILVGAPEGKPMVVEFAGGGVQAFGIDLRALSGAAARARIDIFSADHSTLLASVRTVALPGTGVAKFFGWEDAGGIGRIELYQAGFAYSPAIDNLEFGNFGDPIPEPSTILVWSLLGGIGLLAIKRVRLSAKRA